MKIFEFYADKSLHQDLSDLFTYGAQQHQHGLVANFLEKDVWVTEILRLLYDEQLLGEHAVAFKGGTALSKCWSTIGRFSEDIDLSIHWADLSGLSEDAELEAWLQSITNNSQKKKFRDAQQKRLMDWSQDLTEKLNHKLDQYQIEGLVAEVEPHSNGEKVDIHFPRVTQGSNDYQLDHILLEFGGRNRGKPTQKIDVNCYLDSIAGMETLQLPTASVNAYQKAYILWEKLTALHQFSTQTKAPNPTRLARHWYDVDCLFNTNFANPATSMDAMKAVIEMKQHRWLAPGVDYQKILDGGLTLIPDPARLASISQDHDQAVKGGMFFTELPSFATIVERLQLVNQEINAHLKNS